MDKYASSLVWLLFVFLLALMPVFYLVLDIEFYRLALALALELLLFCGAMLLDGDR